MEAIDSNTATYGETTFVRLTASDKNVEDSNGNQLLLDSENSILYYVEDGVPQSTSIAVTDEE